MVHTSTLPMPQAKNNHQPCKPFLPFKISQGRRGYNKLHEKHAGKTSLRHFLPLIEQFPQQQGTVHWFPIWGLFSTAELGCVFFFTPMSGRKNVPWIDYLPTPTKPPLRTGHAPIKILQRHSPEATLNLGLHVRKPSERILTAEVGECYRIFLQLEAETLSTLSTLQIL